MLTDLRFAIRMVATHPWFSLAVITTLALGIGINTTVFTLVNAVLMKPVPVPRGERLVHVDSHHPSEPNSSLGVSYPDFRELRANNRTFDGLEASTESPGTVSEADNPPERFTLSRVSVTLFDMLQIPPVLGRGFTAEDEKPGAPTVMLIGHRVWQKRYAGRPDVVGRTVRLNGLPATIIGVMPPQFRFPSNNDLWVPLTPTAELAQRGNRSLHLFGILRAGVSLEEARVDLGLISARLAQSYPDTNKDVAARVRTFHDTYNGDQIRVVFLTMLGAVGFVLLIACANVANMMLARSVGRARELSVRAALGASRGQLVRQLLIECVCLSVVGGVIGLGLSRIGVWAFDLATENVGKPYWIQFTTDYVVFGYFAAISVLSGLVFGIVPALRASRVDLNSTLKSGAPTGGSGRGGKLTAVLVMLQFALTVVLLAGAGVMIRAFFVAQQQNAFVRPETLLTARLQLAEGKGEAYAEAKKREQFYDQLLPRLAALPGVSHAEAASFLPGMGSVERDFEIDGRPAPDPKQRPKASVVVVTPGYLAAIGQPVLRGRVFNDDDGREHREGALVTRAFAAQYWPDADAVGQRFRFIENDKPGPWNTVVGICGDIAQNPGRAAAPPLVYLSYRQEPWGWMALLLRSVGDPSTIASAVRGAVQATDTDLPLYEVRTLPAAWSHQRWFLKTFGSLFLAFAVIALLMASVGIYAVVAQTTGRRTREIGIRMALGATGGAVVKLVLARGLWQLGIGVGVGLIGAYLATGMLAKGGLLLDFSSRDPSVFVSITALLGLIGLLACWLPARRAARIPPTEALRAE